MEEQEYTVGTMEPEWGNGDVQNITFIVTEDCNLRCKYCYITHKAKGKKLALQTAKKFIDYLLNDNKIHRCQSIILDFIGGEPLLEAELIEDICDYFKIRSYEEENPWYWRYRINISTNGVNYSDNAVQRLIENNKGKISIGITIDGTKEKHDLQRVFPDGTGSYDVVNKNIKLWLEQFPGSTKVTFASDDLKYLKESIVELWNKGIYHVAANVVYEDVWKDGDEQIFENQLKELADYIIENNLYNKNYCSLFLDHIGMPYDEKDLSNTSCGAGKMLALSPSGDIYPCMRYYDYSLNNKKGYIIGNVDTGIDFEKARVFLLAMYKYQCDKECLECSIAKGCEFCQGVSYDESESGTNFQKAKYICKMHKARVRANNYYFAKLYHEKGIKRENFYWKKELIFILDDDYSSYCSYNNTKSVGEKYMRTDEILRGLEFAEKEFMHPIFIHSKNIREEHLKDYRDIEITHYIPIEAFRKEMPFYDYQIIVDYSTLNLVDMIPNQDSIIFNIEEKQMNQFARAIQILLEKSDRINVNFLDLTEKFDYEIYERQLEKCNERLKEIYLQTGKLKEINVITDILFIKKHEGCPAGNTSIALAPDGRFYICPAFYSQKMQSIGNIENGVEIKNQELYTPQYMPLCNMCDAYQCENCKYLNYMNTNEINVSPSFQCKKAIVEKKAAESLCLVLKDSISFLNIPKNNGDVDPINVLLNNNRNRGYY